MAAAESTPIQATCRSRFPQRSLQLATHFEVAAWRSCRLAVHDCLLEMALRVVDKAEQPAGWSFSYIEISQPLPQVQSAKVTIIRH